MLDSGWHTNRAPTWYLNWVSLTFDLIVVTTLFMLAWLLVTATGGEIDLPGDSIFLTRFEVVSIVLLLGIMKTLQRRAAEFNQYRSSRRSTEKTQQPGFHDAATGKVLAEFQDEISGNPTINELGDAIARSSSRVLEFDRISIIALDLGNGASSLMYALGGSATVWAPGERHVLPVGLKTALQVLSANRDGTILTRKELIRIGDINPTVYEIIPTWGDLNSVIAIPLVSASDEPIALLFYLSFSRRVKCYSCPPGRT
jgi:hypothetical protein